MINSEEGQALQHLIERYDVKIATHIGVIIGIIFGSFTILGFLRGAGLPKSLNEWQLICLITIEILILIPSYHSVFRAIHYSAMVERLKSRSETLRDLERNAFRQALETMPRPARRLLRLHEGETAREIIFCVASVIWIGWIVLIYAVLTLPN